MKNTIIFYSISLMLISIAYIPSNLSGVANAQVAKDVEKLRQEAELLAMQSQHERAGKIMAEVHELDPDSTQIDDFRIMARGYFESGDTEKTKETIRAGLKFASDASPDLPREFIGFVYEFYQEVDERDTAAEVLFDVFGDKLAEPMVLTESFGRYHGTPGFDERILFAATVDADGYVTETRIITSPFFGLLTKEANLAIEEWEFMPGITNGRFDTTEGSYSLGFQIVPTPTVEPYRTFPPVYPQKARDEGIKGWVWLEYSVGSEGEPFGITVVHSYPGSLFSNAAIETVGSYQYRPVILNGMPGIIPKLEALVEFQDP